MKSFLNKIIVLLLVSFVTILILLYSQKSLFRILPSEYGRHALILDALKINNKSNNILFFGDSRTMFGVNTKIIEDNINYDGDIYNLSTVGQGLYESSYYYGFINSNTKAVVQTVSPSFFSRNIEHRLNDDKAISMFLSGYKLNDEVKKIVKDNHEYFNRSDFVNLFYSRSYYRSYIHSLVRPLLDNEVTDRDAGKSLYFPHSYTRSKHPNYPVYNYNCNIYNQSEFPFEQVKFLNNVNTYFKSKNIQFLIIVMPINPDECAEAYDSIAAYVEQIDEVTEFNVIDLSGYIKSTDMYYDGMHLNKSGAEYLSNVISGYLGTYIHETINK